MPVEAASRTAFCLGTEFIRLTFAQTSADAVESVPLNLTLTMLTWPMPLNAENRNASKTVMKMATVPNRYVSAVMNVNVLFRLCGAFVKGDY